MSRMARTDLFILKPVLAIVVSVFILLLGLRAEQALPVRQFPKTISAEIRVETTYYGAEAGVVAGFITTPMENAMAKVDGIDYLLGSSATGSSTVIAHLRLNMDPDKALIEIQTQISSIHDQLPPASQTPSVHLISSSQGGTFILGFHSAVMSDAELTDYLTRVVQPQFQSIQGVQTAEVWGKQPFALRAWIDPNKLTAFGLTAADVSTALANNNFTSGAGQTAGQMVQIPLGITTGVHSARAFRDLVIKQTNGAIVRLGDVAQVELGADNYQQLLSDDGFPAKFIDIEAVPNANVVDVVNAVRARFDALKVSLPQGLEADIVFDVTTDVRASITEVAKTLAESLLIVTLVVFAFLRSARASLIPVVTIPLSLIGTFAVMWMLGFSINLLTLLALVLATGLVVDDAIIVVENVSREMAEGASPLEAALRSARGLAGPIVAMTVVLIAVYIPIALRTGLTGALFTEDALADDVPVPAAAADGRKSAQQGQPFHAAACLPAAAPHGAGAALAAGRPRHHRSGRQLLSVSRRHERTGATGGYRQLQYRRRRRTNGERRHAEAVRQARRRNREIDAGDIFHLCLRDDRADWRRRGAEGFRRAFALHEHGGGRRADSPGRHRR
jgi:multidrug efflux pump